MGTCAECEKLDNALRDLMNERDRRYGERFAAQEQAVRTAQQVIETRLEGMNEWRQTVTDIMGKAMPRPEAEQRVHAVAEKLNTLSSRLDKMEGKGAGLSAFWGYIVGAVGAASFVASIFMKHS